MGWQSRLKDKPKFEKTCNKCSGTGIKRKFISVAGIQAEELIKCKCTGIEKPTSGFTGSFGRNKGKYPNP